MVRTVNIIILLIAAEVSASLLTNKTSNHDLAESKIETRRKKKERSTSSSEGARDDSSSSGSSMALSSSGLDSTSSEDKKNIPKSSLERSGWRKWHRKCKPCLEDMAKKWRDPSIKWICGGYQRARRSFKSVCMMRYRNCQDGTMFVKIHNFRCKDDPRHGDHFFYDYKVKMLEDSSKTTSSDSSESDLGNTPGWFRRSDNGTTKTL